MTRENSLFVSLFVSDFFIFFGKHSELHNFGYVCTLRKPLNVFFVDRRRKNDFAAKYEKSSRAQIEIAEAANLPTQREASSFFLVIQDWKS